MATQVPLLLLFTIMYLCVCPLLLFAFVYFPIPVSEAVSYREEEKGRSASIFKTINGSNPDTSSERPSPRLSGLQRDKSTFVGFDADLPQKSLDPLMVPSVLTRTHALFLLPCSLLPSVLSVMFY